MEDFSSTGQLVTLGLVDSSIGTMAKGLALVDVKVSIAKAALQLYVGHFQALYTCSFLQNSNHMMGVGGVPA